MLLLPAVPGAWGHLMTAQGLTSDVLHFNMLASSVSSSSKCQHSLSATMTTVQKKQHTTKGDFKKSNSVD
jgi:hypothetical protein